MAKENVNLSSKVIARMVVDGMCQALQALADSGELQSKIEVRDYVRTYGDTFTMLHAGYSINEVTWRWFLIIPYHSRRELLRVDDYGGMGSLLIRVMDERAHRICVPVLKKFMDESFSGNDVSITKDY